MFVLRGLIAGVISRLYIIYANLLIVNIRKFTDSKIIDLSGQNDPENIYC